MKRLKREKLHWFRNVKNTAQRTETVNQILQHCVLPRSLFLPNDAVFCAKFIRMMHSHGTPSFSTLTFYDRLFSDHISSLIFIFTLHEAENYGQFLMLVLSDLAAWHKDERIYNKEARGEGLPGFLKLWEPAADVVDKDKILQWDEYRRVFFKWHQKLFQV